MKAAGALGVTIALMIAAAGARAQSLPVTVQFQSFAPYALDALSGDTVTWGNGSGRTHTVTADNGAFDSGDVPDGQSFSYTFTTPGTYTYHCTIHRGMLGVVSVRRVSLDPLPTHAVPANTKVVVSGRTADPATPVRIQSDLGSGFRTVASATPHADGTWRATVKSIKTARLRAASGADVSQTRRLLVINKTLTLRITARGIAVHVAPASPHALVALEFRLRDRFGWWAVLVKRLDRRSNALLPVGHRHPVRARVALLGADHWTRLAISRAIHVR
jgi:plastocyanin